MITIGCLFSGLTTRASDLHGLPLGHLEYQRALVLPAVFILYADIQAVQAQT